MCDAHYQRFRRNGHAGPAEIRQRVSVICVVEGCDKETCGQGLCSMHYQRQRRGRPIGDVTPLRRANGEGCTMENGYRIIAGKLEHRALMEQMLGRPLLPTESVHHVNGQRDDNRITDALDENFRSGNLELWSTWQPAGQRVSDKVAWAIELLERYDPERLRERRPKAA
jgi:hypothetical protein